MSSAIKQLHEGQIVGERAVVEDQRRTEMERQSIGEAAANVPLVGPAGVIATVDQANETCRLQFRFPDGSSMSREFHPHEILEDVVAFVGQVHHTNRNIPIQILK